MDSRLRGNDEENQSPGNHGFPPFPRVSPVIPAQVSPAIPAQVSPVIPAQVSPAILAGFPRQSRAGGNPYRRPGYETTRSLHHGQQPEKPEVGTSDLAIWQFGQAG